MVVLVPKKIKGEKGDTREGAPEDALGYAAEGAAGGCLKCIAMQYDPAKFPLSDQLKQKGLSEEDWASILKSLRDGRGCTGVGFGFSKAIHQANKDYFEELDCLACYAEYGMGQKAMVVLPFSALHAGRIWVPDDQMEEINKEASVGGRAKHAMHAAEIERKKAMEAAGKEGQKVLQPAAQPLALCRARAARALLSSAAQTDAAIAANARGDALTTTLGYVQRRAALREITNHI